MRSKGLAAMEEPEGTMEGPVVRGGFENQPRGRPGVCFATLGGLTVLLLAGGAEAGAPITSPIHAVAALRGPDLDGAVKTVDAACRGRTGRALKDQPMLLAEAKRMAGAKEPERRRRALDLHRCFSEPTFRSALLLPRFDDGDVGVVAYALEVGARLESAAVAEVVVDRLEAQIEACLDPELAPAAVEVCVWLAYTPGTGLANADDALRARAGTLVARTALESPHPKVREVSVETLAATRLKGHAVTVRTLIAKERKKAFEKPNDPALLSRFEKRARSLSRGWPR